MTIYGIKNCNTVKASLDWLKKREIEFEFHDYKSKGITEDKLNQWSEQVGWENLINKKGLTWRRLDEKIKEKITNQSFAVKLMCDATSVIKRPLIEKNGEILTIGFDESSYQKKIK